MSNVAFLATAAGGSSPPYPWTHTLNLVGGGSVTYYSDLEVLEVGANISTSQYVLDPIADDVWESGGFGFNTVSGLLTSWLPPTISSVDLSDYNPVVNTVVSANATTGYATGYTRQWQEELTYLVEDWSNLSGETNSSYTVPYALSERRLRCVCVAQGPGGNSDPTPSTATWQIPTPVPVMVSVTLSDYTPEQSDTISASPAASYADSYSYEWRYSSDGSIWFVTGVNSSSISAESWVGFHLQCLCSATNPAGTSDSMASPSTETVVPSVPANLTAPYITTDGVNSPSGPTQSGATLSANTGSWSNSPTSYSYEWYVDNVLQGETSSTFITGVGTVTCKVLATNGGGSSAFVSSSNSMTVYVAPKAWTLSYDSMYENGACSLIYGTTTYYTSTDTLEVGVALFDSTAGSSTVGNGYYADGTTYYSLSGGVVNVVGSCVAYPYSYALSYDVGDSGVACGYFSSSTYYSSVASLNVGDSLYTSNLINSPTVADGYYSDGSNYFVVSGGYGVISSSGSCSPPLDTTIAYLSTSGDDGTAQLGDNTLPYASWDAAMAALEAVNGTSSTVTLNVLSSGTVNLGSITALESLLLGSGGVGRKVQFVNGSGSSLYIQSEIFVGSPLADASRLLSFDDMTVEYVTSLHGGLSSEELTTIELRSSATINVLTISGASAGSGGGSGNPAYANGSDGYTGSSGDPPGDGGPGDMGGTANGDTGGTGNTGDWAWNITLLGSGTVTNLYGNGAEGGSGGAGGDAQANGGNGGVGGDAQGVDQQGGNGGNGGDGGTATAGNGGDGGTGGNGSTIYKASSVTISNAYYSGGVGGGAGSGGSATAYGGGGGSGGNGSGSGMSGSVGSSGMDGSVSNGSSGSMGGSGSDGSIVNI